MADPGPPNPNDDELDDWFSPPEYELPRERRRRPQRSVYDDERSGEGGAPEEFDDWLSSEDVLPSRRTHRAGGAWQQLTPRQRGLATAAAALVVLLIGLAAGGVFSGSGTPPQPIVPPTTATAPTTPTTTPPTTTAAPATPPATAPTSTLKPGDSGAQVKVLQRALKSLGYSPGTIDGQYGPGTQNAVKAFQKAAGLTADGVVGPLTLSALTRAINASG